VKDSTSLYCLVDISLENKTLPTLSTIPNLVPVPPISIPIANDSTDDVFDMKTILMVQ